MALKKNLGTGNKWGVDLSQAYIRFRKNPRVDYGAGKATLDMEVYASAAAAAAGKAAIPGVGFKPVEVAFANSMDTPNMIVTAAYNKVKADQDGWPQLVGATDA